MSNTLTKDKKEIFKIAEDRGLQCFFPERNELQLDLDQPNANWNDSAAAVFTNGITIVDSLKTVSVNGNTHVYIRLNKIVSDLERLALQAALGSDPVKEALSVFRLRQDCNSYVSALFETPTEALRVSAWREKLEASPNFDFDQEVPF